MRLLYLILILISCSQILCFEKHHKYNCKKILNELKQAGSLFLICSMEFAVPVNFCINCVVAHTYTVQNYTLLINSKYHNTTTNETEICKEKYFDQDRLNIVQTLYDEINGLWQKAYCNECFSFNGNETKVNNITLKILDKLEIVNGCLQKQEPCYECQSLYLDLNDFYTRELKQKYNNKVCFDLQDAMNRTRFLWSKKLHCCDRVVNLTVFAAVSSVIACLPILFYVTMYFYTKRVERNHDMLIDDSRTESGGNNNTTTVTNQVIPDFTNITNRPLPSTSTREAPETTYNDNLKKNIKDIKIDRHCEDDTHRISSNIAKLKKNTKKSKKKNKFNNDKIDSDEEPIITTSYEESQLPSTKNIINEKIDSDEEPIITGSFEESQIPSLKNMKGEDIIVTDDRLIDL